MGRNVCRCAVWQCSLTSIGCLCVTTRYMSRVAQETPNGTPHRRTAAHQTIVSTTRHTTTDTHSDTTTTTAPVHPASLSIQPQ